MRRRRAMESRLQLTTGRRNMVRVLRAAFGWFVMVTALAGMPALAVAQEAAGEDAADRTLSPYFFVHGDGATEQLPLKATDVKVSIAGVIADVKVTQRYRNDGSTPIEAEYMFPGSTRARRRHRATAAQGHRRQGIHRRRDSRRQGHAALPQRRQHADRSGVRVPRLDPRGRARADHDHRRAPRGGADPREAAGAHRIRRGEIRR